MSKDTKPNTVKKRNWMAFELFNNPLYSSRSIPDKKKQKNKKQCRGKVSRNVL